jgi:TolB-like protein
VSSELVAVVRRCPAQPEDRFQTAGELAEALRGVLATLPRLSTPVPAVPQEPSGARAGRWLVPLALVALAVMLAFTLGRGRGRGGGTAAAAGGAYAASVAVLPFDNLGGDPRDEYFSEGITDEIIGQLAQVESLKVISRTSVMALKGSPLTLPQIAETLGVRHIVEGAVRREGDRVRVTAELIEAASDAHLWAAAFEGNLGDSFRVQEEIARKVSQQLLSSIRGPRPMAAATMPAGSAAFDATLRGRSLLERHDPEAMDSAVRVFEQAVAADSTYAPAYAGLASAYTTYVIYGFGGRLDAFETVAKAQLMAERAIALAPDLAEGHHALADARAVALAPESEVLAELRSAQRLMPSSAQVGWRAHRGPATAGTSRCSRRSRPWPSIRSRPGCATAPSPSRWARAATIWRPRRRRAPARWCPGTSWRRSCSPTPSCCKASPAPVSGPTCGSGPAPGRCACRRPAGPRMRRRSPTRPLRLSPRPAPARCTSTPILPRITPGGETPTGRWPGWSA